MRAVVEIAAAQFPVQPGQILVVPRLAAEPGSIVEFRQLVLVEKPDGIQVGTPYLDGVVRAEVLEHGKGPKVIVFKKKRRKGYKRLRGHRQWYTRIRIVDIAYPSSPTIATL